MWQHLIEDVGLTWVLLMLFLIAGLLALIVFLWALMRSFLNRLLVRIQGLTDDINTLPEPRIENLKTIQTIVGDRAGPLIKLALQELAEDSRILYQGFWVPDPSERLFWRFVVTPQKEWLLRPSLVTLPVFTSVIISFLGLLGGLSFDRLAFTNDWARFLSLVPLILGGVSFLLLQQVRRHKVDALESAWTHFLVRLKRKLPVYNQAAETAALLERYVSYDERMTKAVRKLTDRVDALASGDLTRSVSEAVETVMTDAVVPPITQNSQSLEQLTVALAAKMLAAEEQLLQLHAETGDRQRGQLDELEQSNQAHWAQLQEQLGTLLSTLETGQQALHSGLLADQKQALTAIQQAGQTHVTAIQNDFTALLAQQRESQDQLLTSLLDQQQALSQSLQTLQIESYQNAQAGLQTQLDTIQTRMETLLEAINTAQQDSLAVFTTTQQEAIAALDRQQQEGVQALLDRFTASVTGFLSESLDPVAQRLQAAAETLVASEVYASGVVDTLARHKAETAQLFGHIQTAVEQFTQTRDAMTGDLDALARSASVMSDASSAMSAVYTGSQTGLSDSIDRMSADMVALSKALKEVLQGSAEQTRLLQEQAHETYEINQKHLDAVRSQIDILSGDLATRIDQLMIGFTSLTEELIQNVQSTIDNQNDALGGSLKVLTDIMADEARSISLYAQQINMDIDRLSQTLGESVTDFSSGLSVQLNDTLTRLDSETADILRRLSISAAELGDAVAVLPDAIRTGQGQPDPKAPDA